MVEHNKTGFIMNDIKCECKDNKIYYVLAGGGLVLLTYLIKNRTPSYQQQLHPQSHSSNQEQSNNNQRVTEMENQLNALREQINDQTESIQRYLQYRSSKLSNPAVLTVQQMNDKKEDVKRRFMFNML